MVRAVIVGNGIAGVTAAIRLRELRPEWEIAIVSGESAYHYSRPALMYVFMGHMRYRDTKPFEDSFWGERRLELVRAWVRAIDLERKVLELHGKGELGFDKLLIATGSKPNRFGWPGQDLAGVQGLWGLQDLEMLGRNVAGAERAVIVGGGLIGIELAEMLHSRHLSVTLLVRERSYWNNVLPDEESEMVNRVIRRAGLDLRLGTSLAEIEDDGRGRAAAVRTDAGERIACQIVGLTAGVSPNVDLVRGTRIATGRGVLVDASLATNVPDVFAAGDCAEIVGLGGGESTIQQVWYTGRLQGETAARSMAGEAERYDPGIWYNSAKFLDLEYQVYGRVGATAPGAQSLYWEHANGRHALRLVHAEGELVGVNLMGMRYRHEVCERWIREARPIAQVLAELGEASFDPEFFERHEPAIRRALEGQLR